MLHKSFRKIYKNLADCYHTFMLLSHYEAYPNLTSTAVLFDYCNTLQLHVGLFGIQVLNHLPTLRLLV